MRIIRTKKELGKFMDRLRLRASGSDQAVEAVVNKILMDVKENGDKAVLKYTRKFDDGKAERLNLRPSEITKFSSRADAGIVRALEISARRIRKFHEMQSERSWSFTEGDTILGQYVRPIRRVGVYVPGGKAAYPSSVLMNVIPAQVAGVKEIALCVPAVKGDINPYVMAAVEMLGVKEVYRIGGAQAIGALAYGTESIEKVDKIVGPGNVYVAAAKKMVFGLVDIDMIAGPSEILIIADRSAKASFVASDLLSQAEHDEFASSILLTDSSQLALQVSEELATRLPRLKRKKIAQASIDSFGAIILIKDICGAVDLANQIAPEHLEVMTEKPMELLPMIENAGAIFLGPWSPEPLGDYAAGPNHTLPTGGTSRFFSPLGVYDFYKRSSIIGFTKRGFLRLSKTVEAIADIEGLEAHGNTVRVRREKNSRPVMTQLSRKDSA
jgi:histidinol dehydrogenase